jgi:hypothetical protein
MRGSGPAPGVQSPSAPRVERSSVDPPRLEPERVELRSKQVADHARRRSSSCADDESAPDDGDPRQQPHGPSRHDHRAHAGRARERGSAHTAGQRRGDERGRAEQGETHSEEAHDAQFIEGGCRPYATRRSHSERRTRGMRPLGERRHRAQCLRRHGLHGRPAGRGLDGAAARTPRATRELGRGDEPKPARRVLLDERLGQRAARLRPRHDGTRSRPLARGQRHEHRLGIRVPRPVRRRPARDDVPLHGDARVRLCDRSPSRLGERARRVTVLRPRFQALRRHRRSLEPLFALPPLRRSEARCHTRGRNASA